MKALYALLAGINDYRLRAEPLHGCRNDVELAHAFLRSRTQAGTTFRSCLLRDSEATKEAIIDGFRSLLRLAGPNDTALFWFSGYGTQTRALLCAEGKGDASLRDTDLTMLLSEVAESGAHVVAVIDAGFSGGTTSGLRARYVASPSDQRPPLLKAMRSRPGHVTLAACGDNQAAYEMNRGGRVNGIFSLQLLRALGRLGTGATYRELLTAAGGDVTSVFPTQHPVLCPKGGDGADQVFLAGRMRGPASPVTMRCVAGLWEIDAGACHGLISGTGEDALRVAVHDASLQECNVVRVLTERSLVEPIGWKPDCQRQYSVVFTNVPMPSVTVAVPGGAVGDALRGLAAVRVAEPAQETPDLWISASTHDFVIAAADGTPVTPPLTLRDLPASVEHIGRWRAVRQLTNPLSGLANAVRLEISASPLLIRDDGVVEMSYVDGTAPSVFLRLHNTSERPLYCVLLDLTDRFEIHAELFDGQWIGPRSKATVANGQPVTLGLKPGRRLTPGSRATDWLMLLTSETEFSSVPFRLPPLGEAAPAEGKPAGAVTGILDRLGLAAIHRNLRGSTMAVHDWSTSAVRLETVMP